METAQTCNYSSTLQKLRSKEVQHLIQSLVTKQIKLGLEFICSSQASLPPLPLNLIDLTLGP